MVEAHCESAPEVDLFVNERKYLILLGKIVAKGEVTIGADHDPILSPIQVSKSTAYAASA